MLSYPCEMANTINIPKSHLIMGLSLPLAVLVGYFLAEPLELGSMAVVVAVLAVLCIPLVMRWYHPVLVFCWNATIDPVLLPGRPPMWAVLAFVGLGLAILARAVNPKARFIVVPSLTRSLLVLAAVTIVTGLLTGGFGVRSLGSEHYGGRKYFILLAAIAGYFALTSRQIPPHRVGLYIACFMLSGLTSIIANIATAAGPKFDFLLWIFSTVYAVDQITSQGAVNVGMVRIGGLCLVGGAIYAYLLARFGIRGLLDLSRPWRLLLFVLAAAVGLYGGFRSYVALFGLSFLMLFFLEGLHRTRYLPVLMGTVLLGSLIILPQANKLPLVVQRALSFLPGRFDPLAVESGSATITWRVEMWKQVLPEVPRYLFRGKGFAFDPGDLYLAAESQHRFQSEALAGTITVGDYHSGPLSILIPFGIYGMIAFLWVLIAGLRVLYRNYRFGSPDYHNINTFILAFFAARVLFFFVGFGGLHSDMPFFTGLLGMSVALNGAGASIREQAEQPAVGVELNTEYIRA
jgi:hypothetical protein